MFDEQFHGQSDIEQTEGRALGCLQEKPRRPKLFGIGAAWLRFATEIELRRLAVLHVRIERKKRALADIRAERDVIARRCEKRMQRTRVN